MADGGPRWNAERQRWEIVRPAEPEEPRSWTRRLRVSGAGDAREPARDETVEETVSLPGETGVDEARGPRRRPGNRTAVIVAGSVTVWLTVGLGGSGPPPPAPTPTPTVTTVPPSPSPSLPTPSPQPTVSPSPTGPPAGYRVVEDPAGFTAAVPDGWTRSKKSTGVFYTSADGRSLLQIFVVTEPGMTPEGAVEGATHYLANQGNGYRQLALGTVEGGDENPAGDAAELLYSYDSPTVGPREAVERVFTATDGKEYAVLVAAPADRYPYQRQVLQTALGRFAPAPGA